MKRMKPTTGKNARDMSSEVEVKGNTFTLPIASSVPVNRGGYFEVLDMAGADLTRLQSGAVPVQDEHWGPQVGVCESGAIDGDRVFATIRFSKTMKGWEIEQDVSDGIKRNVSIGFNVYEWTDGEPIDGKPVYVATKWEILELSIVSVPADFAGVGFNRSLNMDGLTPDEMKTLRALMAKVRGDSDEADTPEDERLTNVEASEDETEAADAPTEAEPEVPTVAEQVAVVSEKVAEVTEALETLQTSLSEFNETAEDEILIDDAVTADDTADVLDEDEKTNNRAVSNTAPITVRDLTMRTNSDSVVNPNIVLNEREQREYSLMRAVRNSIEGKHEGLEYEISQQIAKTRGADTQGFYMPTSVRSFAIGDSATAGAMTFAQGGEFIDFLRNKAVVVSKCGAQAMTLPGKLSLPRLGSDLAATWISEDGSGATYASASLDQVTFSPKKLATYTGATREALTVANYDVENAIRSNIYSAFVTAFDRAALQGTGGSQPTGLLNTTGLVSGTLTGALSYAAALELLGVVAGNNGDSENMVYLTTPSIKAGAMGRIRSGSTADFVVSDDQKISLYNVEHSNNVSSGYLVLGSWESLVLAEFGAIEVIVDPYTSKHKGIVEIAATMLADVQVKTIKSFAVQKSLT